ncbi:DUF327 family protein [Bacillus licheniformis]|nr:DUF327 family protein [Bacillus licheniformis]
MDQEKSSIELLERIGEIKGYTMIEKQQTPPARGENVSASFKEKMNIQSGKLRVEQLTMLLTDIEAFGKRLSKSRNFKDLARFKGLTFKLDKRKRKQAGSADCPCFSNGRKC